MSTQDVLDLIRAARRSRIKTRVWGALAVLGVATAAELAEAAFTTVARVHGVMLGDGAKFAYDTALVNMRMVEPIKMRAGPGYAITPTGRAGWSAVRHRVGYTEAQVEARWPREPSHLAPR